MARLLRILLSVLLAGMFASGSASAAIVDLGVLGPGNAKGLFGMFQLGVTSTDTYEFDISGLLTNTVGISAVSLLTSPGSASTFDITSEMREWNGTSFVTIPGTIGTGGALILNPDVAPGLGSNNNNQFNRHFELSLTGTPTGTGIATYGGSLALVAVPEPSLSWLLIGGLVSIVFLTRRRVVS
jgi:hypothetical protein